MLLVALGFSAGVNNASWVWSAPVGEHFYSCASTAGSTNDLGTAPTACIGDDPTCVNLKVTPGKAECLVATVPDCKIPMRDFVSMDYDFTINSCNGVWAAPLWMTPDTWQWGAGSGEIDSLEFCTRDSVDLNFAGGGHQLQTNISLDMSSGHVTVRKDGEGIVTIKACSAEQADANGGQCPQPEYTSCEDCQWGAAAEDSYACWCNPGTTPSNIYGSGGCRNGGDCLWTLVSDIWNGVSGDSGYAACMTAVPSIGLEKEQPNLKSHCEIEVKKIVLKGSGPNQSLKWGAGSSPSCAALTTSE